MSVASCKSSRGVRGVPAQTLAAASPAAIAAELLPSPRAGGMLFSRVRVTLGGAKPISRQSRSMVCHTRLSSVRDMPSEYLPVSMIWKGPDTTVRVLCKLRARPKQSNPGPRLAEVAGTVARTNIVASLLVAYFEADDIIDLEDFAVGFD